MDNENFCGRGFINPLSDIWFFLYISHIQINCRSFYAFFFSLHPRIRLDE